MKPFNLKKALAGHPLVTRDGREAVSFRHRGAPERYPYQALVHCGANLKPFAYDANGIFWIGDESPGDLFLTAVATTTPTKPRPKSETRKNVERVRAIIGRDWVKLETIERELQRRFNVYLPEQSVSARVRDLRKDEYGGYDVRKKQVGKGLFAYKNFGKKGAKA